MFKIRALHYLFVFSISISLCSAADSRTKKFGFYLGVNGDPAPSAAGANFALNPTSFARIHLGVGGYSNAIVNAPRAMHNYVYVPLEWTVIQLVKPVAFFFAWLGDGFDQFVSKGKVKTHLSYQDFWQSKRFSKLQVDYIKSSSIFSYGSGINLFIPNAKFTPTIGAHWASYHSNGGAFGIEGDDHSHLYYSGGFDYMTDGSTGFGAGVNFCPGINKSACGIYGQIGHYF